MIGEQENIFFYLTCMNENYVHPPMPSGVEDGILKGMYLLQVGGQGNRPRPVAERNISTEAALIVSEDGDALPGPEFCRPGECAGTVVTIAMDCQNHCDGLLGRPLGNGKCGAICRRQMGHGGWPRNGLQRASGSTASQGQSHQHTQPERRATSNLSQGRTSCENHGFFFSQAVLRQLG
jgi:hypothetical protein